MIMDMFILLAVIQVLSVNEAYNFSCPSQAQWNLRAQSMCKPARNYTCLYDLTRKVNAYRDRCSHPRILAPGYRYVFQPNLNRATCSITRYQPFIFDTVGYSDCAFLKSLCHSEGQTTYENGNTTSDRTCICRNYNGYTLVKNPMNQSYCNPLSEDCSCFVSIHHNNKSNCSKDSACSVEIDIMQNRSLKYTFNISQSSRIIDLDNNRYNIAFPTDAFRKKARVVVLVLLVLCHLVVSRIYILQGFFQRHTQTYIPDIPTAIEGLSKEEANQLEKLMASSEMERRYFLKLMIVGKESVGKTCLLKRLLNESITEVSSTDGVEVVVRRCKIDIQDGKWIIGQDQSNDKTERLNRVLAKSKRIEKKASIVAETKLKQSSNLNADEKSQDHKRMGDKIEGDKKDITTDAMELPNQKNNDDSIDTKSMTTEQKSDTEIQNLVRTNKDIKRNINSKGVYQLLDYSNDSQNKKNSNFGKIERTGTQARTYTNLESDEFKDDSKTSPLVMPANLMYDVLSNSSTKDSARKCQYASCGLWDFAGQREFYATHQAFLTGSGIYILVTSMEDDVEKGDVSFADFGKLGDYVDFWFDNIHCHQSEKKTTTESLDPPVILVFTGKDKYKTNFNKRKQELNRQLCKKKGKGKPTKYRHHRNTFYLSNTDDSDKEFEDLRNKISAIAMQMKNWGESMPIKWILLEHLIEINKDNGRNFITFEDMLKIAKHPDIAISNFDEVVLFLRFQCEVGNIIFFEDIVNLIILNPQWLANAFRCLVSHELKIDNADQQVCADLNELEETGKISDRLITALFKSKGETKFFEQREDLLSVMKKFDILVEIEGTHSYIMPSMIPSSSCSVVRNNIGILEGNCKMSSWFCLKFVFLPPAFFNHLSVWLIKKYHPCKVTDDNESMALYRGICVFDFDKYGCDKLLMAMSTDVIALQVISFDDKDKELGKLCSSVRKELVRKVDVIKKRYKWKIYYEQMYKCGGDHYDRHTMSLEELKSKERMHCSYHRAAHESKMVYLPWTMDITEVSEEEICYLRIVALLHVAKQAVRSMFDYEFSPQLLPMWIRRNIYFLKVRVRRHVNAFQWNTLHSWEASSRHFDLHLMLCLLRNFTNQCISNEFSLNDTSQSADLSRIWHYRTKIVNNVNGKLANSTFEHYWNDINEAIVRLSRQRQSLLQLKCLRVKKCDLDDQNEISLKETNYLRILHFILHVAREVVRECFDKEFPPSTLETTVRSKRQTIIDLHQKSKLISSEQVALLFSQKAGEISSASLDIKTMIVLMTYLKGNYLYDTLPEEYDTVRGADLSRLWWYRQEVTHLSEFTMNTFEDRWYGISQAVLRLGGEKYTDVCNELKTSPLHASEI